MARKIVRKDWLDFHPYESTDRIDRFYIEQANLLYQPLAMLKNLFPRLDVCRICVSLTALLEDVVSGTRMWEAVTDVCRERYGTPVPFYGVDDYCPGKLNRADVRFLLWHLVQQNVIDSDFVSPFFPKLLSLADEVYDLLSAAEPVAPANQRMQEFFQLSDEDVSDFYSYRNYVQWIAFLWFVQPFNDSWLQEELVNELEEAEDDFDTSQINEAFYMKRVSWCFLYRGNLFALTPGEWLARIWNKHGRHGSWEHLEVRPWGKYFYRYLRREGDNICLGDIHTGEELLLSGDTFSNDLAVLNAQRENEVKICMLVKYEGMWWLNGFLKTDSWDARDWAQLARQLAEQLGHMQEKEDFRCFRRASGGRSCVYCKDRAAVADLFRKVTDGKAAKPNVSNLPDSPMLLMASPQSGLYLQKIGLEAVCLPDNPFYNREKAVEVLAENFCNVDFMPYDLFCMLMDEGLLPDLADLEAMEAAGSQPKEKNMRVLVDYWYHSCREKDFDSPLWQEGGASR